ELVVRRFFATVAPNAIAETAETKIDLGGQLFLAEGYRIKDPGWRKYYPYWTVREAILPALTTGESLDRVGPVTIREDRTKPPARYSEGSLIQEMERVGLGTKATRHEIIKKLYDRKFTEGSLTVIRSRRGSRFLGCDRYPACRNTHPLPQIGIIQGAEENCPECGAPMIKHTDRGRTTTYCVASDCPSVREKNFIGRCEKCGTGELTIRHGNYGKRFVGCSSYPACNNSYPLPQRGLIVPTEERCKSCGHPVIKVISRGRPPWVLCLNMQCP